MFMDPFNQAGKPQSLKILFIGNSYSDDTIQWAWQIATSAGLENVLVANLYRGGCTIEEHLSFLNRDSSPYVFRHSDSQGQIISSTAKSTMGFSMRIGIGLSFNKGLEIADARNVMPVSLY